MAETTLSSQKQQQPPPFAHRHVKAFLSLPSWTPPPLEEEEKTSSNSSYDDLSMIQVIHDGSLLTADNLCSNTHHRHHEQQKPTKKSPQQQQQLSLHRPMLVLDTPESIGMTLPTVVPKKKKKNQHDNEPDQQQFSILRQVADLLGAAFPVRVINVAEQQELPGWTLGDLVDYFHDEERLLRNAAIARSSRSDSNNNHNDSNSNDIDNSSATRNSNEADGDMKGVTTSTSPRRQQRPMRKAARESYVNNQQQCDNEEATFASSATFDDAPMVLNQISLEFSNTPLGKQVRSPQFVRDLDWIDHAWRRKQPGIMSSNKAVAAAAAAAATTKSSSSSTSAANNRGKNKDELPYPAVQYYCLTSAAGCYTDFHVDFGGSSVWYHVLTGAKEFCLIPPTRENLQAYEEWLCSPQQAETFLARTILDSSNGRGVFKVALQQHQTMIIPAGWIHAVYTPTDSLVFGGNFLHGFDIETHLDVYSIEIRSRVLEQYRFPLFIQLHFAAASMYLHKLQQVQQQEKDGARPSTRLLSDCELQSLGRLIEAVSMWWSPKLEETDAESIPAVARRVAAEHDCATFDDFLTMFRNEHARVLASSGQEAVSTTTVDDGKETKPVISSTSSPRLRVKLSSSKVTTNSKVSESTTVAATKPLPSDKRKSKSSSTAVDQDNTGDDAFRIVVSAASRQGTTIAHRKQAVLNNSVQHDNDEWLPSEEKKQLAKKRSVVRGGGAGGAMSPRQRQPQPAKKRTKKAETKTTARQRLFSKTR